MTELRPKRSNDMFRRKTNDNDVSEKDDRKTPPTELVEIDYSPKAIAEADGILNELIASCVNNILFLSKHTREFVDVCDTFVGFDGMGDDEIVALKAGIEIQKKRSFARIRERLDEMIDLSSRLGKRVYCPDYKRQGHLSVFCPYKCDEWDMLPVPEGEAE